MIRQYGTAVLDDGISCVYIFHIYNYPCLPIGYVLLVVYVHFLISYKSLSSSFVYTISPHLLRILYVKYDPCRIMKRVSRLLIRMAYRREKQKRFLVSAIWYGEIFLSNRFRGEQKSLLVRRHILFTGSHKLQYAHRADKNALYLYIQ